MNCGKECDQCVLPKRCNFFNVFVYLTGVLVKFNFSLENLLSFAIREAITSRPVNGLRCPRRRAGAAHAQPEARFPVRSLAPAAEDAIFRQMSPLVMHHEKSLHRTTR